MMFRLILAASLSLGGTCLTAADDWNSLYEAGVEAEDHSDYKEAEALLDRACTLVRDAPDARDEARVCLKLGQTYAVDAKPSKAIETFSALVERLRVRGEPEPLIDALFALADAQGSVGDFEGFLASIREALNRSTPLAAPVRASVHARIAEYYLAIGMTDPAWRLIEAARKDLAAHGSLAELDALNVLGRMSVALSFYGERQLACELLQPAVEAIAREWTDRSKVPPAVRWAFSDAFEKLADAYDGISRERSQAGLAAADYWREGLPPRPERPLPQDVFRVGEGVSKPSVKRRLNPGYTEGALRARVNGVALLAVEVWPDGRAHNIRVARFLPYGLTWNAVAAIRKWRFRPAVRDGKRVKVYATYQVGFALKPRVEAR